MTARSGEYLISSITPKVVNITMNTTKLIVGDTAKMNVIFNTYVRGVSLNNITMTDGTLSNLTAVNIDVINGVNYSNNWTFIYTPNEDIPFLDNCNYSCR